MIRVLHVDENHPFLINQLIELGFDNFLDVDSPKKVIEKKIELFEGLVIRSRFKIDSTFLEKAKNLKFIARVGSGLENIDIGAAKKKGIVIISAPEGNSLSVGEHAVGMLLSLLNKLPKGDREIRKGIWERESNRGEELGGKTVGIIGYGNTGKQFARKLCSFDVKVICHDIIENISDSYAQQVPLKQLQLQADVLSIHLPLNNNTFLYFDQEFIIGIKKPFWLINTARGNQVVIKDLVKGLKEFKIKGACLDVLDLETSSFSLNQDLSEDWKYLIKSDRVILSPHVAGWTSQSHKRLSEVIFKKIEALFVNNKFKNN
jgi:D-3-phosphoglycerate dehydrogenase